MFPVNCYHEAFLQLVRRGGLHSCTVGILLSNVQQSLPILACIPS